MSDHTQGAIWARGYDLERLFSASHICHLVGGYDGSGNYGDILLLHANIERLRVAGSDVLATPLVYWQYAGYNEALCDKHPRLFGDSCFLYYVPQDEQDEAAATLREWQLVPLTNPPQTCSQTVVYGGGFFNTWWGWGAHKLELLDLLTGWLSDASSDAHPLAITGQQISNNFLTGPDADRFAAVLARASMIGVRDELSLENLKQWAGDDVAGKLILTGDDALLPIVAAGSERRRHPQGNLQPTREVSQPYVVNVHLSLEQFVTNAPRELLQTYEAILSNVREIAGDGLTLNLLIAYDDPRISETRYIDQLRNSTAVSGCTVNVVSCVDDFQQGFPSIAGADLTVSCSYHVTLTSLLLGIPTAFVYGNGYYQHKVKGLKRIFQIPDALLFDVRQDSLGAFFATLERVLRDQQFRAQLSADTAQGIATMSHQNSATSLALATILSANYVANQEARQQVTATRLLDTMEQLSDLRLEYGRLLNAATKLSAPGARSSRSADVTYRQTIAAVRSAISQTLPQGAKVLVVGRGDDELLKLDGRTGRHFPQTPSGVYAGHHPADSAAAIGHLEELRSQGCDYLVFPSTSFWWLGHYTGLKQHLDTRYQEIWNDQHSVIYQLTRSGASAAKPSEMQRVQPVRAAISPNGGERARQEPDPIIVYGSPRSGTTYLIEILNRHPQVFVSTETRIFVWAHRTMNVETHEYHSVFRDRGQFIDHLRKTYPDLIRSFYRDLKPDVRYWGDKNPHYLAPESDGCLQTILELFPKARFINIIRDGRGTVTSVLQKGWEDFETAHRWWTTYLDVGCEFGRSLPADQYFELRYEDLIRDDTAMARRMFDFLGIEIHPNVVSFCDAQRVKRAPINQPMRDLNGDLTHSGWAIALTPEQQLRSLDLLGEHLIRFGYETPASLALLRGDLLEPSKNGVLRNVGGAVRDVVTTRFNGRSGAGGSLKSRH